VLALEHLLLRAQGPGGWSTANGGGPTRGKILSHLSLPGRKKEREVKEKMDRSKSAVKGLVAPPPLKELWGNGERRPLGFQNVVELGTRRPRGLT